ncbi:hypothetical protein CwatDRAFT_1399 [Crocosphaera watsonii WH 8501]|uniref:Uncharacterized protein n=1 Tax=Crocosphaera watsonii WH 8501 TaxID=165597 RepID=Q4BWX4_CROWT|nr:hypothetical protein CwatDRAFT_1399 [Crocosphaera watsonii WH 8501]
MCFNETNGRISKLMSMIKALPINLSNLQKTVLQQIVRGTTSPYRLVRRAKLILAAASGESNSSISRRLELGFAEKVSPKFMPLLTKNFLTNQ